METTGFSRSRDRVIELSIYDPENSNAVLDTLVNPKRKIPKHITAITGISSRDVLHSRVPPIEHVAQRVIRSIEKIDQDVLLVGHNARKFDAPFLLTEMSRFGLELPENVQFSDSLDVLRTFFKDPKLVTTNRRPEKFSLNYLREFLGIDVGGGGEQSHRALDDCILLNQVLLDVEKRYGMDTRHELEKHQFRANASSFSSETYVYKRHHRAMLPDVTGKSTTRRAIDANEADNVVVDVDVDAPSQKTVRLDSRDALRMLKLPPMLRQYCETKREFGASESSSPSTSSSPQNPLLLYRVGDFYEAYFEDAPRLGSALDMIVTAKRVSYKPKNKQIGGRGDDGDGNKATKKLLRVPMCGFPVRAAARHCRTLMKSGHVVVVCDQTESAAAAASKGAATVQRKVTRVLTPGTVIEEDLLDADRSKYLVALYMPTVSSTRWGLCYADVSTGECRSTEGTGLGGLKRELQRLSPAELIVPANLDRQDTYAYGVENGHSNGREEEEGSDGSTESGRGIEKDSVVGAWSLLSLDGRNAGLFGSLCFAPASSFATEGSSRFVRDYYGLASLEGVGLHRRPHATSATAALLRYVEHTRPDRRSIENGDRKDKKCGHALQPPRCYDVDDCMIIDEDTWRNLEIAETARTGSTQGSLIRAVDRSETSMGRRLLREWLRRPLRCTRRIEERQRVVREFVSDHDARLRLRSVMRSIDDVPRLTGRVASGTASPNCLLALAESLSLLPSIVKSLDSSEDVARACAGAFQLESLKDDNLQRWSKTARNTLVSASAGTASSPGLIESHSTWISNMFTGSSGSGSSLPLLRPGADMEVDRLRGEIAATMRKMEEVVERERAKLDTPQLCLRSTRMFGHVIAIPSRALREIVSLPDNFRRLQSLKAEERFATPEIVDLDARTRRLEAQISTREQVVFEGLLSDAARLASSMRNVGSVVAQLDVLSGLATIGADDFYCAPRIVSANERAMDIVDGRHPVVEQFGAGGQGCVPNSVSLCGGERTRGLVDDERIDVPDLTTIDPHGTNHASLLIVTGPNAAGKSVFLRQIAITQLLAQIGSFVPASFARLSVVDQIFTRAGGADDVSQGQSTFMVEMSETANILNHATEESLVLLDEIGRGTATYDGLALAQSVSEHLSQHVGCRTIFATHYHELNHLAESFDNVETMHAVVIPSEDGGISFTFEMAPGGAEKSHGVEVAKIVGFPKTVTRRATEILAGLERGHQGDAGEEDGGGDNNDVFVSRA
eukprot:g3549.t1